MLLIRKKRVKGKKSKKEMMPYFAKVNHQIGKVQPASCLAGRN
jgi:hypothetical protein